MLKKVILLLTGLGWLEGSAKGIKGTVGVKVLLITFALLKQSAMQCKVVIRLVILSLRILSWAFKSLMS